MAQLTSQCTNTIYRWQFKRCGSPQQDKGQAVPGGCSLPGCSRGLGRGAGAGRQCVSARPRARTRVCANQAAFGALRYWSQVQTACRGRPPSRGAAGFPGPRRSEGGDRGQHLPCSIYLQTLAISWAKPPDFKSSGGGELPANARVPRRCASAPVRRGGAAFQIAACAPPQITLALMSSEESTRHIGPLDFKTGPNWNHISGMRLS